MRKLQNAIPRCGATHCGTPFLNELDNTPQKGSTPILHVMITKKIITISPKNKYALWSILAIIYTAILHYEIRPKISFEWIQSLPLYILVPSVILAFIGLMAISAYASMYRPIVPGPPNWREPDISGSLTVELSINGFLVFALWLSKIIIFATLLYFYFDLTVNTYIENFDCLLGGGCQLDRYDRSIILVPVIMLTLIFIYLGLRVYDKLK
ncbi:hypothetical protein [Desulfosediminicola sp.]|uniref:hypothetical protein n=1 Tax=Desulfosediminicola sp. TaxID=2886825 RepID=UPI003AF2DD8B